VTVLGASDDVEGYPGAEREEQQDERRPIHR
jgi:hypothetical protein